MVQPTPGSHTGFTQSVKAQHVSGDLDEHDKDIYFSFFGGGDTTIINEGVDMFDDQGEFFVVDGRLYRAARLDQLMEFLKEVGASFSINQQTNDPFQVVWDKVIAELGKINP